MKKKFSVFTYLESGIPESAYHDVRGFDRGLFKKGVEIHIDTDRASVP